MGMQIKITVFEGLNVGHGKFHCSSQHQHEPQGRSFPFVGFKSQIGTVDASINPNRIVLFALAFLFDLSHQVLQLLSPLLVRKPNLTGEFVKLSAMVAYSMLIEGNVLSVSMMQRLQTFCFTLLCEKFCVLSCCPHYA